MEFTLRKWSTHDVDALARYANNPRIANNLRNAFVHPYTRSDATAFIEQCITAPSARQYLRAIDVNGEAVGSIGLFLQDDVYCKSAQIGYWLAEPYWGNGIMHQAVMQVCDYAFSHYDLVRIYADVFANNMGSRRVLEKAGFTLEGILKKSVYKNGQLLDSCMYARIK